MAGLSGLNSRDRRAVLLGAILLIPGLVWMLGVRPWRASVLQLEDQIEAERDLLEREQGLLAAGEELKAALAEATREAESAGRRLVVASNQALAEATVAEALEDAALESRVLLLELRTVSFRAEIEPPPGVEAFRLAVSGEGDFEGFLAYVRRLETHPLLLRISGVTLDPVPEDEDDGPSGVVEFGMVIEGYARVLSESDPGEGLGSGTEEMEEGE